MACAYKNIVNSIVVFIQLVINWLGGRMCGMWMLMVGNGDGDCDES